MREHLILRSLESSDQTLLSELFLRNVGMETERYFHPFPLTQETARELASYEGRDRYYVAEHGAMIVGLSMLRGWDEGYVVPSFGILIDRDLRGRGIGSSLTDFTLTEAQALGAKQVRLSVYGSHEQAVKLYVDRGFVETTRTAVETISGPDEVIVMTKDLIA